MNIAIIGGGITGLSAAYDLLKKGHTVTIFEKDSFVGGLAAGFETHGWKWPLERSYHHFFTNDHDLLSLVHELDLDSTVQMFTPITSIYHNKTTYPFDTALNLLSFPGLSILDRIRTGAFAAFCKLYPLWKPLENTTAKKFSRTICGDKAYEIIWGPLLTAKFGPFADAVAASWLWARVHKRTTSLGYFRGGFTTLIHALETHIKQKGGKIYTNTSVTHITTSKNTKYPLRLSEASQIRPCLPARFAESRRAGRNTKFDRILLTVPSSIATKIISFPKTYERRLNAIPHLWAQTLILETDTPILEKTYWLNMTDTSFPFVAVVGHTNMIDKKQYGGRHITYIANYLPDGHPYLSMTKQQLFKVFLPYLKRLNPSFQIPNTRYQIHLFTAPFAQPVHTLHYSRKAPKFETPIPGVFLANLDSIYPWDRGTNYAIKLGRQAADKILNQ